MVPAQSKDSIEYFTGHEHQLLFSPQRGMRSSAENLLTAHYSLVRLEDRFLGTRWMDESGLIGKFVGLSGRFAKLVFLDVPGDYFSVVFMHEFYGHGARYRELGIEDVDYGYEWPPPYGSGGGWASNSSAGGLYSVQEVISIWTGGVESHQILNRSLRQRWMVLGTQHYREALLYFWSYQIALTYVLDTPDLVAEQQDLNDPQAYIYLMNADHGYSDLDDLPFTLDELKKLKRRDALDPFLLISLYNTFRSYLWAGDAIGDIPMIPLGGASYLPSMHVGLTPFGVETHLENYFIIDEVLYMLTLSVGDETFHQSWGGIGGSVSYPFARSDFSMDVNLNLWKQPPLKLGGDEQERGGGLGGSFSARAYFRIPDAPIPMKSVIEFGYKTVGYLEGYSMDSAPIFLIGVQF